MGVVMSEEPTKSTFKCPHCKSTKGILLEINKDARCQECGEVVE